MSYYLSIGGRNKGPYDLAMIESEYRAGRLDGTTQCWTDSWPTWQPIAEAFPEWGKSRTEVSEPVISVAKRYAKLDFASLRHQRDL